MGAEEIIKKALKRFRGIFPGAEQIEKELIPLKSEEELRPRVAKKKRI